MANFRKTLVLLVLVLVVGGLYFGLAYRDRGREAEKKRAIQLVSWPIEEVVEFSYRVSDRDAKVLSRSFAKAGDGAWQMATPEPLPTRSGAVAEFLQRLWEWPLREETLSGQDLDNYGFEANGSELRLRRKDGQEIALQIGAEHAFNGKRYFREAGKQPVFLAAAEWLEELKESDKTFVEERVLPLDAWQVERIAGFAVGEGSERAEWEAEKSAGRWRLSAPTSMRADGTKIESLLALLGGLKWERAIARNGSGFLGEGGTPLLSAPPLSPRSRGGEMHSEQGSPPPRETLERGLPWRRFEIGVKGKELPLVLLFEKLGSDEFLVLPKDGRFDYGVRVKAEDLKWLSLSAGDLRAKEVFAFYPWQVERLRVTHDGRETEFAKEGDAWKEEVRESVEAKLASLSSLEIRDIFSVSRADWEKERSRFGFDISAFSILVNWREQGAEGVAQEAILHTARKGEKSFGLLLNPKTHSLSQVPDHFEVWELSRDLEEVFK